MHDMEHIKWSVHVLESYWSGFREAAISRERQAVDSFCNTFPSLILPWSCVVRFLSTRGIFELSRPPYSPDLAPADFFLCHKFKTAGAGSEVQNVSDIKTNTTAESKAILLVASDDCLVQLLQIWKKERCSQREIITYENNTCIATLCHFL